jgi:hypothetical protein
MLTVLLFEQLAKLLYIKETRAIAPSWIEIKTALPVSNDV